MKIVFAPFLTNYGYPFFTYNQKPELETYFRNWYISVVRAGLSAKIFIDEPNDYVVNKYSTEKLEFVMRTEKGINPIDYRWIILRDYLVSNPQIEAFLMMDISDTTILKNPFDFMEKGKIYIGDENTASWIGWMSSRVGNINNAGCFERYERYKDQRLLNCGLFGGYVADVMPYLNLVCERLLEYNYVHDSIDMIVFNEVMRLEANDKLFYGEPFNTEFWKWDINNPNCYLQHK